MSGNRYSYYVITASLDHCGHCWCFMPLPRLLLLYPWPLTFTAADPWFSLITFSINYCLLISTTDFNIHYCFSITTLEFNINNCYLYTTNFSISTAVIYIYILYPTYRTIHSIQYNVYHSICTLHCVPYTAYHTLNTVYATICTLHYIHNVCTIHCVPYTMYPILRTLHCR